jgi:hypothetical protein
MYCNKEVFLCLSIFILEIFVVPLPTRATDFQPVQADGDMITFVFTSRHGVVEITDTDGRVVGNLMLFRGCSTFTIITEGP